MIGKDMPLMTIADIIHRRVSLSAREAAALTLAVAREWDRQRALRGPVSVPEPGGIALQAEGRVAFLVALPVAGVDDAAALSALFGQLLGIEETRPASRASVAEGQVVTMTAPPTALDVTGNTVEAFRAALSRFGDDDPTVLAAVFSRAAVAMQQPVAERRRSGDTGPRRAPERRRVPDTVTELRRDLRDFEQQVFEARHARSTPIHVPVTAVATPHRVRPMWMAAACAVAILLGVGITAVTGRSAASADRVAPAAGDDGELRQRVGDVALIPAPTLRQPVVQVNAATPPARARSRRQPATVKVPVRRTAPVPTFAGGARTITWMAAAR